MKRSGSAKPRVRVVWDEDNLEFLEASKTPKQKITEPKTPYYAPNTLEGVVSPTPDDGRIPMEAAIHAEAIRHALSEVASSSQASRSQQSGWTSGDDEFDEMEEEGLENGRQWSFEEHRRVHYDEYRKAKWLKGHSDAEDEDDGKGREVNRFDEGASSSGSTCSSGSCSSGSRNSSKGLDCDSSIVKEMGKVDLQENPLVTSMSN
ncbi:unnamed protein product [Sphagnum balticum]